MVGPSRAGKSAAAALCCLAICGAIACDGDPPTRAGAGASFTSVAVGEDHTCGLVEGGAAYCWGLNHSGQLGDGTTVIRFTPTAVTGSLAFDVLAAGIMHTCGITNGGDVYCWGRNTEGQLGDGSTVDRSVPTIVAGSRRFVAVSAGGLHTCALTDTGAAHCWGSGASGQLGNDTSGVGVRSTQPVQVSGGFSFDSISAGGLHTCGVARDGAIYCWGSDSSGALGTAEDETCDDGLGNQLPCSATPVAVSSALTFAALNAGVSHTCALATAGDAYCWGRNVTGQLGDGTTIPSFVPTAVSGVGVLVAISAGNNHSCGLTDGGTAYCWGANHRGQIGDGTDTARTTPTGVTGDRDLVSVGAGGAHTCALSEGGTAYCWGLNREGELGMEPSGETCLGAPCSRTPVPVRVR